METEISVKVSFNDEMRRFSFASTSFSTLKECVSTLFGLDNEITLKYIDEDGDLITMTSDLELKTAIVPGKVLRLQVTRKGVPPVVQSAPPANAHTSSVSPMEISNPFRAFAGGCAPPRHPPPGFQGPPHHMLPPHMPPPPPHHSPYSDDKIYAKFKEDSKQAKKTLSPEDYAVYKKEHEHEKEAHKQMKAARKQAKHDFKKGFKRGGKWGGFGGRRGHHHGFHHRPPFPHEMPYPPPNGPFPPHHGMPHGMPFHGMPFHPPHHGMPFAHPHPHPSHHDGPPGFGGPQKEPKFVARHVKDITIEDGTQLAAGTPFVKTWRVRNEGPAWPAGCQLHFVSKRCGDNMSGPDYVIVEGEVGSNQEVDISVNLVAPTKPGRYIGYWKLCTPGGRKFGQRMWVSIVVPANNNSSSASSSEEDEDNKLADQYASLVDIVLSQGFNVKRHRVFRLLEKFNGDVQQVSNFLADKAQRKTHKA